MKNKLILSFILLTGFLLSCNKCIRNHGDAQTIRRDVDAFHRLRVEGDFIVSIIQDSVQKVEVKAGDNIISYIETLTRSGELQIKNTRNRCISGDSPKVVIYTSGLSYIRLEGSSQLSATGEFAGNELELILKGSGEINYQWAGEKITASIEGSGKIILGGKSTTAHYFITGSGEIQSRMLTSQHSKADINGSGRIETTCNSTLGVKINGSGKVIYAGNPAMTVNINGSGSVSRL